MTKKQNRRKPARSYIFLALSTLVILMAGGITLFWQAQHEQSSRASGSSIVGPPSLPAATVDAIFARVGSPMVGTGKIVEQAARHANIDDAFALGVWWVETNDGEAGVGRADRNPGSVRGSAGYPAAYDGYTIYPSYAAAITDWFNVLQSRYISRGLTSVYAICYPYVGTSSAPLWAGKVVNLMLRYRGEAPPPTPSPTPVQHLHVDMPVVQSAQTHTQAPETRIFPARPRTTTTQATSAQTTVQTNEMAALSATTRLFLIVFALLAALALALLSLKLRRSAPVAPAVSAMTEQLTFESVSIASAVSTSSLIEPMTPLPALYFNEFSPVLEPHTSELLSGFSWAQWEQEREGQLVAASSVPSEYEVRRDARTTEPRSRRIVLLPANDDEPAAPEEAREAPATGALFARPGLSLRSRAPEPELIGTRSGGLLKRYGGMER